MFIDNYSGARAEFLTIQDIEHYAREHIPGCGSDEFLVYEPVSGKYSIWLHDIEVAKGIDGEGSPRRQKVNVFI